MALYAKGYSRREVANKLGIRPSSVAAYLAAAQVEMGARTLNHLMFLLGKETVVQ